MSAYKSSAGKGDDGELHYKRTVARIRSIQTHLEREPRGGKLKGKVCIVTGVGSLKGIGRASAVRFAHEGARHLYLLDFDPTNLPDLQSTIETRYPDVKVTTVQADASDEDAIKGLCDRAIQEEGQLDVFFANAGWASRDPLQTSSVETYEKTMKINVRSCFLAVRHGSDAMLRINPSAGKDFSGGSIILTASVAGLRSGAGTLDYSASKAAVNSMAKTAPYQLRRTDIRVNSICPGLIETGMTVDQFDYARSRGSTAKIGQLNPTGRFGVAEEIANVALFLASDEASYVNGQNWAVDGGLSASHPVIPGKWA
ncbi:hypothetical protein HDZ31DRAFT_40770 [Schizophyllum fasciatum]